MFNIEINFLKEFFCNNGFTSNFFWKIVKKFLDNIHQPIATTFTVQKDVRFASFPYLGELSCSIKKDLSKLLKKYYPYLDVKLIFTNTHTIGSFFKFKDSFSSDMRSSVVYKYSCPHCSCGSYIGSTTRLLRVRVSEHMGNSYRTGLPLKVKSASSIRSHAQKCKPNIPINTKDFKIIHTSSSPQSLRILESLAIKQYLPALNKDSSCFKLLVA